MPYFNVQGSSVEPGGGEGGLQTDSDRDVCHSRCLNSFGSLHLDVVPKDRGHF